MKLQMKNLYATACAVLPALLLMLPALSSCGRDDYAPKGRAAVTMTFATRAVAQAEPVAGNDLEERERMRTLRVIVARHGSGEIVYNLYYTGSDFAEDPEGRLYKTVTFGELTVDAEGEEFDFYAIANEAGTGYAGSWDDIAVSDLTAMELDAGALVSMNGDAPIPQTGHELIRVKPQEGGGIQQETIQLEFAVAKVKFTVKNTLPDNGQTVGGIAVDGVNTAGTPLFAGGISERADGTAALGTLVVPASGEASLTGYIYENSGGAYRLSATWNGTLYEMDIRGEGVTEIPRGTMLRITVTLAAEVEIEVFNAGVYEWDEAEMDVEFN